MAPSGEIKHFINIMSKNLIPYQSIFATVNVLKGFFSYKYVAAATDFRIFNHYQKL